MKTSSAKSKGRRLQQWFRDKLLEIFPSLTENDVRSASMGAGGEDVLLSERAIELFPYSVECKNVEKLNIWNAIEQAQANASGRTPIVVFKRNRSTTYVVLPADDFLEFFKNKEANK